jgi:hypothetical protein
MVRGQKISIEPMIVWRVSKRFKGELIKADCPNQALAYRRHSRVHHWIQCDEEMLCAVADHGVGDDEVGRGPPVREPSSDPAL